MLTEKEIRRLADGTGALYHFDFSKIQSDYYEPLLKTLQFFAKKNIESLGFSCDELYRAEKAANDGKQISIKVLNSIAKTKSHFARNIAELVSHVLPRSSTIKEIVLSNINFKKDKVAKMIASFSQSPSLESIILVKIPLGDEALKVMLSYLDPNQIVAITIMFCGITDQSANDIIKFILQKDLKVSKNGGIQKFSVSKFEISKENRERIHQALRGANSNEQYNLKKGNNLQSINDNDDIYFKRANHSPRRSPKTDNTQYYPQTAQNKNSPIRSEKTSFVSNSSLRVTPPLSPTRKKSFSSQIKDPANQRNNEHILLQGLEQKNEELKEALNQMRKSLDFIEYDDETFIVGKDARNFINFIHNLENKIKNLEEKKKNTGRI